jgi:replicative DNA helicase
MTIGEAVTTSLEQSERARQSENGLAGLSTGFLELDERTGGLADDDLIVLGGRPSQGKTSLALQIAENMAVRGTGCGLIEIDQSAAQLGQRLLSGRLNIPVQQLRRGKLDMLQWEEAVKMTGALQDLPIYLDDTPGISLGQLRQRARQWKKQHNIGCLVIDHLQAMGAGNSENEQRELSGFTKGLKALAKELHIPIILLSQLTRANEARDNRRPELRDLRGSGSIEQDADVVMFIHREAYYLARDEPAQRAGETDERFNDRHVQWLDRCEKAFGIAEIIIGKQRQGPPGIVKLHWNGETTRFSNYAGPEYLPDYN